VAVCSQREENGQAQLRIGLQPGRAASARERLKQAGEVELSCSPPGQGQAVRPTPVRKLGAEELQRCAPGAAGGAEEEALSGVHFMNS
jgi:hypothetical protein